MHPAPLHAEEDWSTYRDEQHGFAFQYPPQFVIGAYKAEPAFKDAVVLVEPELLGDASNAAIPVGEVSTISIQPVERRRIRGVLDTRLLAPTERTFGPHRTLVFPAYPGPYGETLYYYVVPLSEDVVLEIIAHRKRFGALRGVSAESAEPTHYDLIIEQLIPTLERLGTPARDARTSPPTS